MCGIAGILRFDGQPVTRDAMATIMARIAHRGLDHSAVVLGSRRVTADSPQTVLTRHAEIGLGHRRLSILDLQDAAAQPMFYAERQLCMTYNGEIYNYLALKGELQAKGYVFTTQSDTEVLLAAYHCWGKACVQHLNGMFAFALWDDKEQILFCARDPVGIKPFYYLHSTAYFAFASEALALAHCTDGAVSAAAVSSYFLSMYVATNESIFAAIKKLPPGHTLTLARDGAATLASFWSVAAFEGARLTADSMAELQDALKLAVTRQLQSDVPVGGFLSGGVDSGLITALAAPAHANYHTYSVGYEGMQVNELAAAQAIATRYATRHTAVTIKAAQAMALLDAALNHLSEPIADPALVATYHLTALAAADGIKVLLNGTGGDEIFGGYSRYSGNLSLARKCLALLPVAVRKSLAKLPLAQKTKRRLQQPAFDMLFSTGGSYDLATQLTAKATLQQHLNLLGREFQRDEKIKLPLLYQQMLFDLQVYVPDQLLFLLDQMTMAHTIEGRVPLLDVDIIKLAFNFKAKVHMRKGQTKTLLKSVATSYLGAAHVRRQKQGFAGSSTWWVRHNLSQFKEGLADLRNQAYFAGLNLDYYLGLTDVTARQANDMFILYCFSRWQQRVRSALAS